ncbi:MAG: HIT family protein [Opitutaceae bacterium]|nr:HIT family protein [Opitutaceae bacterium]
MKHAPPDYKCPFCRMALELQQAQAVTGGFVLEEERVFALIPLHYYGGTKGNCLIIPKAHHENLFDIEAGLGVDLLRVSKRLAVAMKTAFACEGISTRQHNEPAGDQDVWHFHMHIFPRYRGDGLYAAPKARYLETERLDLARRLRDSLKNVESLTV